MTDNQSIVQNDVGGRVLAVLLKSSVWLGGALLSSERMSCLWIGLVPEDRLEEPVPPAF